LILQNKAGELITLWATMLFYVGMIGWAAWTPEARPPRRIREREADMPPNILMIGSDNFAR